jgi:hypothetical protein
MNAQQQKKADMPLVELFLENIGQYEDLSLRGNIAKAVARQLERLLVRDAARIQQHRRRKLRLGGER